VYVWWSECGLGFGSDADNFEFKNINVRVCVATLVVLWVRMGLHTSFSCSDSFSVWFADSSTLTLILNVVVNPRVLKRFLSGLNSILLGVYLYVHACSMAKQRSTAPKSEAIKTLL